MIDKINKIIDEKEQYQLKALRLEAENKRLKEVIIKALKDTVIQWKKEYDILDSIIEIKDAKIKELKAENDRLRTCLEMQRIDETNQYNEKVNFERENYKLKQILQEIKKYVAKICKEECGYVQKKRCPDCDCRYGAILDFITKAESEEV